MSSAPKNSDRLRFEDSELVHAEIEECGNRQCKVAFL